MNYCYADVLDKAFKSYGDLFQRGSELLWIVNTLNGSINIIDPDQTAPLGVCPGSAMCVQACLSSYSVSRLFDHTAYCIPFRLFLENLPLEILTELFLGSSGFGE